MEVIVGLSTIVLIVVILTVHFYGYRPVTKLLPPVLSRIETRYIDNDARGTYVYLEGEMDHGTEDFFSRSRREGQG